MDLEEAILLSFNSLTHELNGLKEAVKDQSHQIQKLENSINDKKIKEEYMDLKKSLMDHLNSSNNELKKEIAELKEIIHIGQRNNLPSCDKEVIPKERTENQKSKAGSTLLPPSRDWRDALKPKAGTWECKSCLNRNESNVLYCVSCESPKEDTVRLESNTFSFQPSAVHQLETPKTSAESFLFGSPAAHEFEFKPRTARKSSSPGDEESDGIYFKPVVPLPDKVEVNTGERYEEALFCQSAKLCMHVHGKWKVCGIGDLKILRNEVNNNSRVFMRTEPSMKIYLNLPLASRLTFTRTSPKEWHLDVTNFLMYTFGFASAEISQGFMEALIKARCRNKHFTINDWLIS